MARTTYTFRRTADPDGPVIFFITAATEADAFAEANAAVVGGLRNFYAWAGEAPHFHATYGAWD